MPVLDKGAENRRRGRFGARYSGRRRPQALRLPVERPHLAQLIDDLEANTLVARTRARSMGRRTARTRRAGRRAPPTGPLTPG